MEVNEIINPYFSFPVVGVVICAVLVYAFGFKAPVQPPSFDFDGDRKLTSANKKRKVTKKSLTNGHVSGVTAVSTTNGKSTVANTEAKVSKPSSPKARPNATHSNSENSVPANAKLDSESKVTSPRAKVSVEKKGEKGKKEKIVAVEKKRDEGEWVQLLSRKEKKNRKRDELIEDAKESIIAVIKEETIYKKRADSTTPSNSKENSPSKTKKISNKNDINKSKVMREKLDDNIENKPEIAKPTNVKAVKPVKNETKADSGNETSSPKKKKVDVPAENPAQVETKKAAVKEIVKQEQPAVANPVVVEVKQEAEKKVETGVGKIAFDDLGDPWEETKSQKKKKKTRRDQ